MKTKALSLIALMTATLATASELPPASEIWRATTLVDCDWYEFPDDFRPVRLRVTAFSGNISEGAEVITVMGGDGSTYANEGSVSHTISSSGQTISTRNLTLKIGPDRHSGIRGDLQDALGRIPASIFSCRTLR